jgi:hypothetical protein
MFGRRCALFCALLRAWEGAESRNPPIGCRFCDSFFSAQTAQTAADLVPAGIDETSAHWREIVEEA